MALEYRVFFLTHGQMPPNGSTSCILSGSGGIMWFGEENTFPTIVKFGNILPKDIKPELIYKHRLATKNEIDEYKSINII